MIKIVKKRLVLIIGENVLCLCCKYALKLFLDITIEETC